MPGDPDRPEEIRLRGDQVPDADEINAHVRDGQRALGRYVALFASLVKAMRHHMERRMSRPGDPPLIAELAFAEATAGQITNAFFAMCRELASHDPEENGVVTRLARAVREEIEFRNDVAHGDWRIGSWAVEGLGDAGFTMSPLPPAVLRIKPARRSGPRQERDVDLDVRGTELIRLRGLVAVYGDVCFGTHPLEGEEVGIRDVLTLKDGRVMPGPKSKAWAVEWQ